MDIIRSPLLLVARLCLAYIFLVEAWGKITAYGATAEYMTANGVSPALLPLVILTELGAGILVAIGLFTRLAALALAGFCLLTAFFFHTNFADIEQVINFNKNICMAGGFIALIAAGAGALSIDGYKGRVRVDRSLMS